MSVDANGSVKAIYCKCLCVSRHVLHVTQQWIWQVLNIYLFYGIFYLYIMLLNLFFNLQTDGDVLRMRRRKADHKWDMEKPGFHLFPQFPGYPKGTGK